MATTQELKIGDDFVLGIENVTTEEKHEVFGYMLVNGEHEVKKLAEVDGEIPVDVINWLINICGVGYKAMFYSAIVIESVQKALRRFRR